MAMLIRATHRFLRPLISPVNKCGVALPGRLVPQRSCSASAGEESDDLWDGQLARRSGDKFETVFDDASLSLVMHSREGDKEKEVLGTVKWDDIYLINLRSTNWGPGSDDLFYDIYDSNSGVNVLSKQMFVPLTVPSGVDLSAQIVAQMIQRGIHLDKENFDKGILSTEHASFVLHFDETKCRAAVAALEVENNNKSSAPEERLIECTRRIHYLYRPFFLGQSRLFPGLQPSEAFDPRSVLLATDNVPVE
jgi:hypothetical protein